MKLKEYILVMKKMFALISVLAIIVFSVLALMPSVNPAGLDYSPNTGDTPWEMIIFIGLGVVAVLLLIFVFMRKKNK